MINAIYAIHFEKDMEKKKQMGGDFLGKTLPNFLTIISKRLEKNGSKGFLVGDKYTIADFYIGSFLTTGPYNEKFE